MKKLMLLSVILFAAAGIVDAATGAYSPVHVQHLKNCSPYTEVYTTQIQTGDEKSPYINLESTETIVGTLNGKCITKSSIRSVELGGKEVISARCALSKDQKNSIIEKMTIINKQNDEQMRQKLQEELVKYIKDSKTCTVKNYLDENSANQ